MNAGKSTTSIFQTASMPSSGYSSTSTLLDVVEREAGGRAADRAEVEAAVRRRTTSVTCLERLPLASITIEPPAAWNCST